MKKSNFIKRLTAILLVAAGAWASNVDCADVTTDVTVNITVVTIEGQAIDAWLEHDGRIVKSGEVFVLNSSCDSLELTMTLPISGMLFPSGIINGEASRGEKYTVRGENGNFYEREKVVIRGTGGSKEVNFILSLRGCQLTWSITYVTVNIHNAEFSNGWVEWAYNGVPEYSGIAKNGEVFRFGSDCGFMIFTIVLPPEEVSKTNVFINGKLYEHEFYFTRPGYLGETVVNIAFGEVGPTSIPQNFTPLTNRSAAVVSFAGIRNGQVFLNLQSGNYTAQIFDMQGRLLSQTNINATNGLNAFNLRPDLAKGIFILNVEQAGVSVLSRRIEVR